MTTTRSALASTTILAAAAFAASPAFADNAMAEKFAADRLAAFGRGDVAALVDDAPPERHASHPTRIIVPPHPGSGQS